MHQKLPVIQSRNTRRVPIKSTRDLAAKLLCDALEVRVVPTGVYSGVAFLDYNSNGVRDLSETIQNTGTVTSSVGASIDHGVGNVIVRAFNAAGFAGETTTSADGIFSFTPTGSGPYRFEFSLANLGSGWNFGPQGPDSGTSVQFVQDGGGSNLNVGLVRDDSFSVRDPLIVTSIFNYGNPLDTIDTPQNPNFGDSTAIRVFRYSDGGISNPGYTLPLEELATVPFRQVGAVYGLGVNQFTREVFASAYFKRFSGFGPGGTGAIYRFVLPETLTPTFSPPPGDNLLYADLNAIFGANTTGDNRHDTVDENGNGFADDYDDDNGNIAWDAVGKTGLGGLDVSTDGRFIFVMNLADRQLYRIPTSGPLNTTTIQRVSIPLSNPDSTGTIITADRFRSDDLRPFAVRYYRGEVYVGVTYTAETLATGPNDQAARNELMAAVYRLNPLTMTFDPAPIFTARLNYPRSQASTGFNGANPNESPWRPWRPQYFSVANAVNFGVSPQPMFSDISFDAQGNMTLGLRDRGADQHGFFTRTNPANPNQRIEGFTTGDMLKAFINNPNDFSSGWVLESNGRGPNGQGTGPQNNNAGPGGGEFYFQDQFTRTQVNPNHGETSMGALLQVPGRPDVISTQMDPGATIRTGGVAWVNTSTGAETKAYDLYASPLPGNNPTSPATMPDTFGKANGLGGLAGVFGLAPIEIGNRIWLDSNHDGIQTPGEPGLAGIVVQLLDRSGTVISEATTDATGHYYFSTANGTSTDSKRFGLTLIRGESYTVRVPNVRGVARQAGLNGRVLTTPNADNTAGGDVRDSDGILVGNNAEYTYVAGAPGQNDHTIDFGFFDAYSVGNRVWFDVNNSGTIDAADGVNPGISGVTVRIFSGTDTTNPIATTTTDANGYYLFDGLPAGDYTIEIDSTSPALNGLQSSTLRVANPNTNTLDGQNHGFIIGATTIRSGVVTLGPGDSEPTGETDLGPQGQGDTIPDARGNMLIDFGFFQPATYSIGGNVFIDSNNDGDITGEVLITGQPITFVLSGTDNLGNPVSRTITTTDGTYNFTNLPASDKTGYTITQLTQPVGFLDGRDTPGTNFGGSVPTIGDVITGIVIDPSTPSGTAGKNYNFGELLPARLGDFVWLDVNGNGRQDGGEEIGIDGITVTLSGIDDRGAVSKSVVTAGGGKYEFTNLRPGTYTVTFGNQAGATIYRRTVQNSAVATTETDSNGNPVTGVSNAVTLVAGENNPTIDQGLFLPVSLGNRVWFDANGDGLQQSIEPGLPGSKLVVTWYGPDGVLGGGDDVTYPAITAGADGVWNLNNLPPGKYRVEVFPVPNVDLFTDSIDDAVLSPLNPVELVIPSGTTRFDIDFGFRGTASIGDLVWHDVNGNGVQDPGEPGIPNVPVVLTWYGVDGVPGGGDDYIATVTTDASGKYLFENLPSGNYKLSVDTSKLPANFLQTFDLDGLGTPNVTETTLTLGQARRDVDFGYRGIGVIGDLVWYDVDGDGVQGTTALTGFEPGIPGAIVTLIFGGADNNLSTTADNLTYTTTTDTDGKYLFTGLFVANPATPGVNYQVTVTPPPEYTTQTFDADGLGTPNTSRLLLTTATPENRDQDFGYRGDAGLGNFVWLDVNGNGRQDAGEPGIDGISVTLLDSTGKILDITTTTTKDGEAGFYSFPNLIAGKYSVVFGNKADGITYTRTIQNSPVATIETDSNGNPLTGASSLVVLAQGEFNPTIDQGLLVLTSLGDTVWHDVNRDGTQQAAEPGLPGVVVALDYAGPDGVFGTADDKISLASTITNANGVYNFPNLIPGVYRVRVDDNTLPNGISSPTFDLDGLATANVATGLVTSGTPRLDFDFGYVGTASLGDTVWLDLDKNGKQNNNEPGIPGVVVNLVYFGADGILGTADDIVFASQTTDVNGKYLFEFLPSGKFQAVVDVTTLPEPYAPTFDLDSGTTNPDSIAVATLTIGQNRTDVDFGFTGTGSIGDRIWLDRNGDGKQDPGEPGIPNIPVTLTFAGPDGTIGTADDVVLTTTTNNNGIYRFDGLPGGIYRVAPGPLPPGYTLTGDPEGPLDGLANVLLNPGQTIDTIDFGYNGLASISGQVFVDLNDNGIRDPGELPIPGTILTLSGTDEFGNAINRTTTTGIDGQYLFDALNPGVYTVTQTQPALWADGQDRLGTVDGVPNGILANDRFSDIRLTANDQGINYDFGEIPAAISGIVFLDRNQNGDRDPNEPPLAGVVVTLRDNTGNAVATATTGPDGKYQFVNLPAGKYTVEETQPAGFGNPPSGPFAPDSRTVTLPPGGTRTEENFGNTLGLISGSVYVDANDDGFRQPGEVGIPNTIVTLINATTGQTVGTATTDVTGAFSFTDLPAGTYRLVQTQPAGFLDGRDTPGTIGGAVPQSDTIDAIVLPPGGAGVNYLFGELASTITGVSYFDRDNNGVFDPAVDRPLEGIVITLRDQNGNTQTFTTGPDGRYEFTNLPAGTYTITEAQPAGFGNSQNPTNEIQLVVPPNVTLRDNNFGNVLGSLSGLVYVDFDLSGAFNTTGPNPDRPLPGITITLFDGTGNAIRTTTTDANGRYRFDELPLGTYTVVQTQPPLPTTLTDGFYDGADNLGSLGGIQPAKNQLRTVIGSNPNNPATFNGVDYNFGELPPADPFGFVYNDVNRNGRRDPGEPGIPNVAITISGTAFAGTQFERPLTAADIVGGLTTRTDANGRWEFVPIPPGNYTIRQTQPPGWIDGLEENADPNGPDTVIVGNDVFSNIVLSPFPIRGPFNFGEFRILAEGPLEPIDFFPPLPTVPPGVIDPSKREFLSSSQPNPGQPTLPPTVAPQLPTSPNFGAFNPSQTRTPQYLGVAEDAGGGLIRVFDYGAGVERFRFRPFPDYTGSIRVATADVTGDGIPDFIVVPGVGGGPIVRVFDGSNGAELASWFAFEPEFRGGLQVAAGDFNGDGFADIIVAPDVGGGPIVRGYDGRTFAETINFFALDPTFRGGLRLAAGDVNNDGAADLLVTAGVGGGPRVAAYNGRTLSTTQDRLFGDFFGFAPELRNGFFISSSDVNGDGFADIVLGAGIGGAPRIAVYSGRDLVTSNTLTTLADYFGGDVASREGTRVKAIDLNNDGRAEVVSTAAGLGFPIVYVYNPLTGQRLDEFYAFAAVLNQSVYLG